MNKLIKKAKSNLPIIITPNYNMRNLHKLNNTSITPTNERYSYDSNYEKSRPSDITERNSSNSDWGNLGRPSFLEEGYVESEKATDNEPVEKLDHFNSRFDEYNYVDKPKTFRFPSSFPKLMSHEYNEYNLGGKKRKTKKRKTKRRKTKRRKTKRKKTKRRN